MAASIAPFTNLHRSHSATILADPPWQFANKTGKVAPEHRRLHRYQTMTLDEIMALPVEQLAAPTAHLYLWCPNALLPDGLAVMKAWGFSYKTNIVWHKIRKDGGSDGRGVGFYFRNDEDRKVLHIHVAQLNQLLAAHGVMVRSEAGQYCIRSTTP